MENYEQRIAEVAPLYNPQTFDALLGRARHLTRELKRATHAKPSYIKPSVEASLKYGILGGSQDYPTCEVDIDNVLADVDDLRKTLEAYKVQAEAQFAAELPEAFEHWPAAKAENVRYTLWFPSNAQGEAAWAELERLGLALDWCDIGEGGGGLIFVEERNTVFEARKKMLSALAIRHGGQYDSAWDLDLGDEFDCAALAA